MKFLLPETFAMKGSQRAVIQIVMVLDGELWIDDVVLTARKSAK